MKTKRNFSKAAVLIALVALVSIAARTANAQDQLPPPQPDRISFAMVGITAGQTLRVNVSNIVATSESGFPPGPTRVAFIVINSHGDPFRYRDGSPVRKVVMLERGDSAFLDLNADDLQYPPGPTRLQLRAVVNAMPPPQSDGEVTPEERNRIVASVEVFNNANGRTVFVMSAPRIDPGANATSPNPE